MPGLMDINYNNKYWQEFTTSNHTFYLYAAYLDIRKLNKEGPTVRVLTMTNIGCNHDCSKDPTLGSEINCVLWFGDNQQPIVSKVIFFPPKQKFFLKLNYYYLVTP